MQDVNPVKKSRAQLGIGLESFYVKIATTSRDRNHKQC